MILKHLQKYFFFFITFTIFFFFKYLRRSFKLLFLTIILDDYFQGE